MENKLLTTAQVAALLGVTPVRVRQYEADGRLKAIRVTARMLLFDPAEVRKFSPNPTGRPPTERKPRKRKA